MTKETYPLFHCPNCAQTRHTLENDPAWGSILRCNSCKTGWTAAIPAADVLNQYPHDDDEVCYPEDTVDVNDLAKLLLAARIVAWIADAETVYIIDKTITVDEPEPAPALKTLPTEAGRTGGEEEHLPPF